MNKVFLIGNLTRDPELRSTSAGLPVCNFGIAVNRRRSANGQQETDFFNIVAWRQLAELCSRYLAKGKKVAVCGSIQIRNYEGSDGSKRTAVDIVADDIEFLPSSQGTGASSGDYRNASPAAAPAPRAQAPAYAPADSGFTQVDDDDLPF